jgi:hypothetical protein
MTLTLVSNRYSNRWVRLQRGGQQSTSTEEATIEGRREIADKTKDFVISHFTLAKIVTTEALPQLFVGWNPVWNQDNGGAKSIVRRLRLQDS